MDGIKLPEITPQSPVPRYVQAKRILIDAIKSGTFPRGSKLPSTGKVGDTIRVSLLTAHKAIQCLVEEGWLERQRGRGTFVRQDFEQSVAAKACFRIGLLISPDVQFGDYYHDVLLHGLRQGADSHEPGAELFIQQQNAPATIPSLMADGVICFHPNRDAFDTLEVVAKSTPTLVLGGSPANTNLHCVDAANGQGVRDAVGHLADLGHRDIAIVNGRLSAPTHFHRLQGYLAEMRTRELPIREGYILDAHSTQMTGAARNRLSRLLDADLRPTAIIASGYHLALDVMEIAGLAGLRIPRDLSLVGFDDPKSASLLNPPLTTVRQPLEQMGQLAIQRILQLASGTQPRVRQEILPTELIVRASTARIRGN
ncbi:MAG: GntR family transcriptional regulator [Phycisphaerae bacterium]|nr:GntR family transcriptional regulator [Phycisphaerae bacterium]